MLQIHHLSAAEAGGGGGCGAGGTPRLRCLYDARGSGIVRVTCLREAPLVFAEVSMTQSIEDTLLDPVVVALMASNEVYSPLMGIHGHVKTDLRVLG